MAEEYQVPVIGDSIVNKPLSSPRIQTYSAIDKAFEKLQSLMAEENKSAISEEAVTPWTGTEPLENAEEMFQTDLDSDNEEGEDEEHAEQVQSLMEAKRGKKRGRRRKKKLFEEDDYDVDDLLESEVDDLLEEDFLKKKKSR